MTVRNIFCLIAIFTSLSLPTNAQEKEYSTNDLNELMAKVWLNCKIDLDNLRGYTFNETDSVYGKKCLPNMSDNARVQDRFDYVWTVNNGHLRPSLKRINGREVPINGKKLKITKKEYFLTWNPSTVRLYVNLRQNPPKWEKWDTILDFFDDFLEGWYAQRVREPFDYKPREYKYVGSREYEGHHVIEIDYPSSERFWGIQSIGNDGIVPLTNGAPLKTLVRMLIIPDENQLVAISVSDVIRSNIGLSRGEWTMTMDNSHENVWLPKEFRQLGTSSWGMVASDSRDFNSYAKTGVKAKFWFEDVKTKIIYDLETPGPQK